MNIKERLQTLLTQTQEPYFFDGSLYTDPKLLPLEIAAIFRKTWIYVGDAACLAKPGTVWTTEVAGCSVLIVHTPQGELKAFHNVCPHRASLLCPEAGISQVKQLVCPYHAWVYNLDGELIGTPAKERFPESFRLADFPLKSVRCEQWQGFIFVSFTSDVPPLQEFLGSAGKTLESHRTEATKLLGHRQYQVNCNWKNYHDNTLCDYHVPVVHRQTLNVIQGPVPLYEHYFEPFVNLLYTPTTQQWRAENQVLDHLQERARFGFFTYGIFPNLHLIALPNGVLSWLRIDPITVETCQVNVEIYGIPGMDTASELIEEFEAFMHEDMTVTEMVQRGYASGAYTPGVANQLEDRILHQQRLIRQFLLAAE